MAVNLSPVGGAAAQFFDNSGNVLTGGLLYTYAAGTTTPATTYTSNSGITAHPNPIVLNAAGRVPDSGEIWLNDGFLYKFVLKDSNDVQIAVWDNIDGINSNFVAYTIQNETQTATQGQTIFNFVNIQYEPATNNLAVYVNGSKQILTLNYTETDTNTITFLTGLNVGDVVQVSTAVSTSTNVVSAENVGYNEGQPGAVTYSVQKRLSQFVLITDFGAVCDGVTDDSAAVQDAIDAIGTDATTLFIPGPTLVSSSLTFGPNLEVNFLQGGKIIGNAGTESIIFQKQIIAGVRPILANCVATTTTGVTIRPEWFGAVKDGTTDDLAAFENAFDFIQNTGGVVQLEAGFYTISDQLNIGYNDITIQGAGNNVSWIKVTGANKNGLKVNGVVGTPIYNIMLRDFSIILGAAATSACFGLQLYFCAFPIIERMQVQDFLYGVRMEGATNSQLTKVGATYTGATNGFIGFPIYGGASGAASANASSILKDCYSSGVSGLTGQIGFKVYGSYMSDLQFDTCETALTNYGFSLDYASAPNFNVDIIIRNPIVDRYFTQGILVDGLASNGMLQIIGGYSNPDTLGATAQNMYLKDCLGAINVVGHEFMAPTNITYTDGLFATNCTGLTIANCLFSMLNNGVNLASCGYSVITANIFKGGNPTAFTKMVKIVAGARIMVNGNSFSGATEAVSIDAISSGCGIVGNTANISTVTTRYTNAGSGPIGGVDGSTGLNSGV